MSGGIINYSKTFSRMNLIISRFKLYAQTRSGNYAQNKFVLNYTSEKVKPLFCDELVGKLALGTTQKQQ